MIHYHEIRASR